MTFTDGERLDAESIQTDVKQRIINFGWVRERDGMLNWIAGVYLDDVVAAAAKETCLSYDRYGYERGGVSP